MKKSILFLTFAFTAGVLTAQQLTTTSASVAFDATTPADAFPKAENKTVIAAFNKATGVVAFEAAVANFAFPNPRIQEHFNGERWLNSATHSKFTFSGKVDKLSAINFDKDGSYTVNVSGDLTVKGISKPVTAPATVVIKDGKVNATSAFTITLADYGITGAPIESGKVDPKPKISVSASF